MKNRLEVHLETKKIITPNTSRRAHRINEKCSFSFEEKGIQMFHEIIEYLDVENSVRYQREPTKTFDNVYAYDFCSFTWAYLPRVYWKKKSLSNILAGQEVKAGYGETVRELSTNMLYDFFLNEGKYYHNWEQIENPVELQNLANEGHICIISAKNSNTRRSGHMTIVPPEYKGFTRKGAIPVQSQAGAGNFKYKLGQNWYLNNRYSDFGFFVNRRPKEISFKGAQ